MLDHLGKLRPGSCQAEHTWTPHCEVREAVAQVLTKGMPTRNHISGGRLFESTHGVQALFQMPVVTLYAIVEVLLSSDN